MPKIFLPQDIDNLKTTMNKRGFYKSAQACAVLEMISACLGYGSCKFEKEIDKWCEYILNLENDIGNGDRGSIFRLAARFCDDRADNYRDEHATTEVYR